jgi:DNA-binding NtrC family response regulator
MPDKARVLIVDDDVLLTKINETRLKSNGYQVTAVLDSVEALEIFRNRPQDFEVLITDQIMPNLKGSELVEIVLKINPDLQVIMCTGYSDMVSEEEAIALGVKKYISKPVCGDELIDAVHEVLGTTE